MRTTGKSRDWYSSLLFVGFRGEYKLYLAEEARAFGVAVKARAIGVAG